MSAKIRHIDFSPDEYIAGVGGEMTAEQQGVYWMVCSLIYSHGDGVEYDAKRIGRLVCLGPAKTKRIINELVSKRKLTVLGTKLIQKRSESELGRARKRIETAVENGKKGGRPHKENKDLEKGLGLSGENLTTNHQPPTNNHQLNGYHFEDFYNLYPNKKGRASAEKSYKRVIDKGTDHDDLMKGLERYLEDIKANKTEKQFIAHPATWLNQGRWDDEYDTPKRRDLF